MVAIDVERALVSGGFVVTVLAIGAFVVWYKSWRRQQPDEDE